MYAIAARLHQPAEGTPRGRPEQHRVYLHQAPHAHLSPMTESLLWSSHLHFLQLIWMETNCAKPQGTPSRLAPSEKTPNRQGRNEKCNRTRKMQVRNDRPNMEHQRKAGQAPCDTFDPFAVHAIEARRRLVRQRKGITPAPLERIQWQQFVILLQHYDTRGRLCAYSSQKLEAYELFERGHTPRVPTTMGAQPTSQNASMGNTKEFRVVRASYNTPHVDDQMITLIHVTRPTTVDWKEISPVKWPGNPDHFTRIFWPILAGNSSQPP